MIHTADDHMQQVQSMFRRFLASWATDVLRLRRQGLDRPGARQGGPGFVESHLGSPAGPSLACYAARRL